MLRLRAPNPSPAAAKRRQVFARLLEADGGSGDVFSYSGTSVTLKGQEEVVLDKVLQPSATQVDVFRAGVRRLMEASMEGSNTACLVYGPSSPSKSQALFGAADGSFLSQACRAAFNAAERLNDAMGSKFTFHLSAVDIHGKDIYDLGAAFPDQAASESPRSSGSQHRADALPLREGTSVASVEGSMPSVTGLVAPANGNARGASEAELAKFRAATVWMQSNPSGGYDAQGLTKMEVSSPEEVLACVQAALEFRLACAPYGCDAAHAVVTLYCKRENTSGLIPEPLLGSLHFVDLAAPEFASGPDSHKGEAEVLCRDFAALSKVLRGDMESKKAVHDSALTRFMSPALTGTAHTQLIANVELSPASLSASAEALRFASKCMAAELRAAVPSKPAPQYVVIDHEAAMEKMAREVKRLQHELRQTHSHYQQILSKHAPRALGQGPVERGDGLPEADGSDPGTGEASFAEEAEDPGGSPPAGAAAQGSESQAVIQTVSVVKSVGAMRSAVGGKSALRALEAKVRELEELLERQRHRNETLEAQVGELREQLVDAKESRMQSDHLHYKQSKKLTEQAKLLKEQANAQQEQMLFRINAERDEAADKISTLKEANDTLRHELGSMMGSIPRFIDTRTREVADEKDFRATIRAEAREELSKQVRLAEANSQRQVANLKAQGEYLLAQKAKEVERLAQEKAAQAARADAKELELLQELGCVYEYANRLAKIVENVESGKYNIKALRGKKVYQIPGRDKPVPLDMDRLQHLSMKLSQTAKFQEEQLADSSSGAEDDERPAGRAREPLASADSDSDPRQLSVDSQALSEQYKRDLQAQVMAELTSNETVEYIRALESDVQRYRREVQSERRKMHDLRIALESSQRASIPSPWGSALGGATRDYRNLSASAPVAFPSKWGHPLGLADTSAATGCRPGTAPEHLKTLNRPPAKRMSTPPAQTARLPSGAGSFGYRTRVSSAAEPGPSLPSAVNTRPQP